MAAAREQGSECSIRTEVGNSPDVAGNLFAGILPQTAEEFRYEVSGCLSRLFLGLCEMYTDSEQERQTGRAGRRGSRADSSRRARGSKNNLNHS